MYMSSVEAYLGHKIFSDAVVSTFSKCLFRSVYSEIQSLLRENIHTKSHDFSCIVSYSSFSDCHIHLSALRETHFNRKVQRYLSKKEEYSSTSVARILMARLLRLFRTRS